MTRTENEAIEIFCRLLALEIHQITGRTIDSLPEGWVSLVRMTSSKTRIKPHQAITTTSILSS